MTNPKTLVFSFDGTGNEPSDAQSCGEDESVSNILKLHVLLGGGIHKDITETTTAAGNVQNVYYYNGIGTRESALMGAMPKLGTLITKASQFVNQAIAPTWGDARKIIKEARADFKEANYKKGDTLVVFGFSRGAALARQFVSQILKEHSGCEVSFLGVFDTVAAMSGIHRSGEKISSDVVFENGTLHQKVKRAVHIVSIDEDRIPFTPTLINEDTDNLDRILEVWFPGVHSDIGGGYWYDGLSDSALQFMIEQCRAALGNSISFADGTNAKTVQNLIDTQKEALEGIAVDDIIINENYYGLAHTHTGMLAKAGDQEPRKVCVCKDDRPSGTLPLVHYSVKKRFDEVQGYRPPALRNLEFKLLLKNSNKKKVHGIAGLRALPKKPA